jgi:hypothetical protein
VIRRPQYSQSIVQRSFHYLKKNQTNIRVEKLAIFVLFLCFFWQEPNCEKMAFLTHSTMRTLSHASPRSLTLTPLPSRAITATPLRTVADAAAHGERASRRWAKALARGADATFDAYHQTPAVDGALMGVVLRAVVLSVCVLALFCFVLFCFVLFCFVLFCFVLFCFVLFCFVGFCLFWFVSIFYGSLNFSAYFSCRFPWASNWCYYYSLTKSSFAFPCFLFCFILIFIFLLFIFVSSIPTHRPHPSPALIDRARSHAAAHSAALLPRLRHAAHTVCARELPALAAAVRYAPVSESKQRERERASQW